VNTASRTNARRARRDEQEIGGLSRRRTATDSQTRDDANIVRHCLPRRATRFRSANMKKLKNSSIVIALLLGAAGAQAQVGVLQGTVTGVKAGTVLPVFKGETKVADIKVEEGGKFSVALATGVYTVNCPNGKVAKVAALNGASTISINCQ